MGVQTLADRGGSVTSASSRQPSGWHRLIWLPLMLVCAAASATAEVTPVRQSELKHLLEQDCGSCHGLTLNGGLGPALTAQALENKPKTLLTATILHGRPGTPMPPWRDFVSEEEATWLVDYLMQGAKP